MRVVSLYTNWSIWWGVHQHLHSWSASLSFSFLTSFELLKSRERSAVQVYIAHIWTKQTDGDSNKYSVLRCVPHPKIWQFSNHYCTVFGTEVLSHFGLEANSISFNDTPCIAGCCCTISVAVWDFKALNTQTVETEPVNVFYNPYLAKFRLGAHENVSV